MLLANNPDDIALAEATVWIIGGKAFLSLFQSYYHTAIEIADAALYQGLTNELTVGADDELTELHFALLDIVVLTKNLSLDGLAESSKLLVATDYLKHIAREHII